MRPVRQVGNEVVNYMGFDLTSPRGYESPPTSTHPLRTPQAYELMSKLESWRYEARTAHAENRREQAIDCDYHDGMQHTLSEIRTLGDRGQPVLKYNVISQQVLWLMGTERRTRVDYRVSPRASEDNESAQIKTKVLKYLSDVNDTPQTQTRAFQDMIKAGVGWIEDGVGPDPSNLGAVFDDCPSWREMFWDPMSRHPDINRDCRYVIREKYVDLDVAISMFPGFEMDLRSAAEINELFPIDDEDFYYLGMYQSGENAVGSFSRDMPMNPLGAYDVTRRRKRVRLYECWYKQPCDTQLLKCNFDPTLDDTTTNALSYLNGTDYNPMDPVHGRVIQHGLGRVVGARKMKMFCAIWADKVLLQNQRSPYRHDRFPYTPMWAYRRDRDGMPYGPIRNWRDPQDDLNKRHSKATHILSTRGIIADEDAFEDWDEVAEELARPDFVLKKRKGYEVDIRDDTKLAKEHISLMQLDRDFIQGLGGGVGDDAMGQATNARTGKAIDRRQSAGTVVTAPLFDNYRFAIRTSGETKLSLVEQYMTDPQVIRLTGEDGIDEFTTINKPYLAEDGSLHYKNDITRTQADFVVGLQDYNDTVRMAMVDSMLDMIGQLGRTAPEAALSLLDLVVENMDIPNREAVVKRVRKLNGQVDPTDEQAQAAKDQQEAEQAQFQKALEMLSVRDQEAKTGETQARTEKILAEIRNIVANTAQVRQGVMQGGEVHDMEMAKGKKELREPPKTAVKKAA